MLDRSKRRRASGGLSDKLNRDYLIPIMMAIALGIILLFRDIVMEHFVIGIFIPMILGTIGLCGVFMKWLQKRGIEMKKIYIVIIVGGIIVATLLGFMLDIKIITKYDVNPYGSFTLMLPILFLGFNVIFHLYFRKRIETERVR